MRYLRTPVRGGNVSGGTARLREAARLLSSLERDHREAEAQRQRSVQTTDTIIRRRITSAQLRQKKKRWQ